MIPQVPPKTGEYALNHEAFCGLLAEVTLDAEDPGEFLAKAVNFANQKVKGTLSCVLLVHPKTEKAHSYRDRWSDRQLTLRWYWGKCLDQNYLCSRVNNLGNFTANTDRYRLWSWSSS